MENVKYLILGAGPAGLAFAAELYKNGERDFLILEKESEVGGLCRSVEIDGAPFDFGGGHFLDVKDADALEFIFRYMPQDEWNLFSRNSHIWIDGEDINSPIEANIWQMQMDNQIKYLKSIFKAGCNMCEGGGKTPVPDYFTEWIRWKMGDLIADNYMLPYNTKIFGENLEQLGTYWLEKLPNVSFDETLKSLLSHKAYGRQPGHASFFYPKKTGYGEVWKRIGEELTDFLMLNYSVELLQVNDRTVNREYSAKKIISTIPWNSISLVEIPPEVQKWIQCLQFTSIVTEYIEEEIETEAQWIYIPDINIPYHRILVRRNFFPAAKGYWTETNLARFKESNRLFFKNAYAYPLNTIKKKQAIHELLAYMKKQEIYGLGRWGEWNHLNSDVVVRHAMELCKQVLEI